MKKNSTKMVPEDVAVYPRKTRKSGRPKTKNWSKEIIEETRILYVQGIEDGDVLRYPPNDELASRHSIPPKTLKYWISTYGWVKQKQDFQERWKIQLENRRLEALGKKSLEFDRTALRLAEIGFVEVASVLRIAQKRRENNEEYQHFSPKGLSDLANAVSMFQRIGRLACGESTENARLDARFDTSATLDAAFDIIAELASAKREGGGRIIDQVDQTSEAKSVSASG